MRPVSLDGVRLDAAAQLKHFQRFLSLPRETLPQLTTEEARRLLEAAARRCRLDFVEMRHATPIFLLLPWEERAPLATIFAAWHAEALPVSPGAIDGGERLALAATLSAVESLAADGFLGSPGTPDVAVVVAPGSTQGSLPLDEALRGHRSRLQAPVALWPRLIGEAPRRRRAYLGARGRVVLGLWGEGANPYGLRDRLVESLSADAYGPRPLDFELLRKLAGSADATAFLERAALDREPLAGEAEERFRRALFEPRGDVLQPSVRHPDRPQAWITIETAEAMEPEEILRQARAAAGETRIEVAEAFRWDRLNIHHPTVQALIAMAKSRSEGPEIWPMAPWPTPSGIFTRALGVGLGEWGIALRPGSQEIAIRFPTAEAFGALALEVAELLLHAVAEAEPGAAPRGAPEGRPTP